MAEQVIQNAKIRANLETFNEVILDPLKAMMSDVVQSGIRLVSAEPESVIVDFAAEAATAFEAMAADLTTFANGYKTAAELWRLSANYAAHVQKLARPFPNEPLPGEEQADPAEQSPTYQAEQPVS